MDKEIKINSFKNIAEKTQASGDSVSKAGRGFCVLIFAVVLAAALSAPPSFAASINSLAGFSSDVNDYTFEFYDADNGLINPYITALAGDGKGGLYVGTWGGVMRFDGSIFSKIEGAGGRVEGVAPQYISALYYDAPSETLWIGSMFNKNAGLFKYRGGHFTRYSALDGLPSDNISSICASGGKIYAGTWGGGVAVFDQNRFKTLSKKNGLSDNYISSLAYSEKTGSLWAGSKFSGANLIKDGKVTIMDDHTSTLVNNYVHRIVIDETQNTVYFGTSGGVSKFNGAAWQNIITGPDALCNNFIKDIHISNSKSYDKAVLYFISSGDLSISRDNVFYNVNIKKLSGRDFELNAVYADENYIYLATDRGLCKIGRR